MVRKKKFGILFTHPIQYHAPLIAKLCQQDDLEVTVFYSAKDGNDGASDPGFSLPITWDRDLSIPGARTVYLRNISFRSSVNRFFGLCNPGIVAHIIRGRFSAFLIHGYTDCTTMIAYVACIISRTPLFFRGETILHLSETRLKAVVKSLFFRMFFLFVRAAFPIGSASKEFYVHYGVPEKKLFFAPYSVDNDFFIAEARKRTNKIILREKLGVPRDLPLILFTAKLIPRKRPTDLLSAFRHLRPGSASLLFVGEGELMPLLVDLASDLQYVFFAGFQNQSNLPDYYAAADIFVLPSAYESFGLVVNEAMCFSLPVIATSQVASAKDLVREGENGFVYQAGAVQRLTSHLEYLVDNPGERKRFGEKSLEIIKQWNYRVCVGSISSALKM